jgi:hypothetical protein
MREPNAPSTASITPNVTIPLIPSAPQAAAAAAPPPAPTPVGLMTRAAKGKARAQQAEAPLVSPSTPPPAPSTAPYALRGKKRSAPIIESSSEEFSDSSEEETPKKAAEPPGGGSVPRILLEGASPPKTETENMPRAMGAVCIYFYLDSISLIAPLIGYVWALPEDWSERLQVPAWEEWAHQDRLQVL